MIWQKHACAAGACLLTLSLTGCGGGGGGSPATQPEAAAPSAQGANLLETALADTDLAFTGASETGLNATSVYLGLALTSSNWGTTPSDVTLTVNGVPLGNDATLINGQTFNAAVNLTGGLNDVVVTGSDDAGRLIHLSKRFWAGANTVTVQLQDANGAAWTASTDVTVRLADAPDVALHQATTAQTTFRHLPSRTILVEASSAANNAVGVGGGVAANNGTIKIKLVPMLTTPSTVSNNDFTQGLQGWTTPGSNAALTPHPAEAGQSASGDQDLTLTTSGTDAQVVSRVFTTHPGTQAVTVRYRFVAGEWAVRSSGFANTDYYSVRLRNQQGKQAVDTNTMPGLGEAAFDANGNSGWRTLRLVTDPAGEVVQIDGVVANVFDAQYDSKLVIDRVDEEATLLQPQLVWDTTAGGLKLDVSLQGSTLADARTVKLYWASGTHAADVLGAAITQFTLPAGAAAGSTASFHVDGTLLQNAPAQASYLLAVAGDSAVSALPDVKLLAGPNADLSGLPSSTVNLLKEAARNAGSSQLVLARTALTPAQQAHAMFLNLSRAANALSVNTATQLAFYGAEGDAVIQAFVSQIQGLSLDQVLAKAGTIEAAMQAEIVRQGPGKVSAHCADPSKLAVVDVRMNSVPAATASRFKTLVSARASLLVEEAATLWHIEATP